MRKNIYIFIPIFCLSFVLLIFLLSMSASAHPGRTDENGGHYDNDADSYHYHHGYPAHQHVNGYCPYDSDDEAQQNEAYENGYGDAEYLYEGEIEHQKKLTIITAIWTGIGAASFSALVVFCIEKIRAKKMRANYLSIIKNSESENIKHIKAESNLTEKLNVLQTKASSYFNCIEKQTNIIRNHLQHQQHLHILLKESFGTEYLYFLVKCPAGHYLDDKLLPHSSDIELHDIYTVYLGSSKYSTQIHYHKRYCRYARKDLKVNAYTIKNKTEYSPCRFCKCVLPDTTWVDIYIYHHRHLKENIE